MLKSLALAGALLCALTINSEARQRHKTYAAHPDCNVTMPCEGVAPSVRGERVVKAMGGFGSARKVYTPRVSQRREVSRFPKISSHAKYSANVAATLVSHPAGCPARAFCGCGAAVRIFGKPVRDLWLAANWFKFPRTAPAPGTVAVRRHHVFVLEQHLGGNTWLAYDANSGRHATRIHPRSIAGYTIVNPRGVAVKYSHWTTSEQRKLIEMHTRGFPTREELAAAFPRHPPYSILATAKRLGDRRNVYQLNWLRIAHQHFARREAEMRA